MSKNAATTTTIVSAQRPSGRRARRYPIEKRSREKRKMALEFMRSQVALLESVVANIPFALLDEQFLSEDKLISDAKEDAAMRDFLRRQMVLSEEAKLLTTANAQLQRLLREHELAITTIRLLTNVGNEASNDWSALKQRWSAITHAEFTPWTAKACWDVVKQSMREIDRFVLLTGDYETTGKTFMGWRDRRKLDLEAGVLHFSFRKTEANKDAETCAIRWWNMHQDPDMYAKAMLGPNVKSLYEIIQHVTPDMMIVRCVERYPNVPFSIHMLNLVFRLRTRKGFIMVVRSIPCPEVQRATEDDDASWTSNFYWTQYDAVRDEVTGEMTKVKTSVNGSLASSSVAYANHWMREAIVTLARADNVMANRNLLCQSTTFPSESEPITPER